MIQAPLFTIQHEVRFKHLRVPFFFSISERASNPLAWIEMSDTLSLSRLELLHSAFAMMQTSSVERFILARLKSSSTWFSSSILAIAIDTSFLSSSYSE